MKKKQDSDEKEAMSYREAMEYVEGLARFGSVPGLDNIKNLCRKLGDPQKGLKFVHIAGTNGKGSVLAFISGILKEAGYRTGRYISPVLFEYRERIQINGKAISQKELCRKLTVMKELCEELEREGEPHPTAFEIETAMAFWHFKEQGCQIVVLECGCGGLLDATNIVEDTVAAVFTSISFDHMQVLGKTLREIAENKAGIMKPGAAAVALKGEDEVMDVLSQRAESLGIPFAVADPQEVSGVKRNLARQVFSYGKYKNLEIHLTGVYQVENAMLAVLAAGELNKMGFSVPERAVYKGLWDASWPGRFQVLAKKPYFIVDGAHNRDGAKRFAQSVRFYFTNKRIIYIIGMLRDKEHEEILEVTCPLAQQVLTVSTKGARGFSAYELALCAKEFHGNVTAADSLEEAAELAYLLADKDTVIIAFGSLSYLGELIKIVEKITAKKANGVGRDRHGKQGKN